jgi:hypothetical protein
MIPPRILVVYGSSRLNATLSYQHGWPRAFAEDARFDARLLNLLDPPRFKQPSRRGWDAVVILHSVFSNERLLTGRLLERIANIDAPKAWFIGNEYKLMPEKMRFADHIGIALLVSQSVSEPVHALYRERLGCAVTGIPNAGLDAEMFRPVRPESERPIDLGYRAYEGPAYLGHDERRRLADAFAAAAPRHGLTVDISLDPVDRFGEAEWADFLSRCKGQLGFEAGTDYFELDDALRNAINDYEVEHPDATPDEIRATFLDTYRDPLPCRTLSSRIVEAAGTRTAQLLIEGDYGGFLEAGVHYIPIRKDFSNVDEAAAMFLDDDVRGRVADNAFELAREKLTFGALIGRFHDALLPVI